MSDDIQLKGPTEADGGGGSGRIHVWSHVLAEIDGHVGGDTTVEQGGVLVGHVDRETATTIITGRIPAVGAVSAVASLTFTHETWEYINGVMDDQYADERMVGWYHSHPHFGIFLSEYDQFIHRNFFSQPWQVAYVVDPLLDQRGFFAWKEGQLVRVPSWQTWHTDEGGSHTEEGDGTAPVGMPAVRPVMAEAGEPPPEPPSPEPPSPAPAPPAAAELPPRRRPAGEGPGAGRMSLWLFLGLVVALVAAVFLAFGPLGGSDGPSTVEPPAGSVTVAATTVPPLPAPPAPAPAPAPTPTTLATATTPVGPPETR